MAVKVPAVLILIFRIYTACSCIIAGSAQAFYTSKATQGGWGKIVGGDPDKEWNKNTGFFLSLFSLIAAILFFLLAILEIILCFNIKKLDRVRLGFERPVGYIFLGIMTLPVSASLGIAGGSLVMIAGGLWLVLAALAIASH